MNGEVATLLALVRALVEDGAIDPGGGDALTAVMGYAFRDVPSECTVWPDMAYALLYHAGFYECSSTAQALHAIDVAIVKAERGEAP